MFRKSVIALNIIALFMNTFLTMFQLVKGLSFFEVSVTFLIMLITLIALLLTAFDYFAAGEEY